MYYKIAPILHVLSKLAALYAVLMLVPTAVSYLFHDSTFHAFAGTSLITLAGSVGASGAGIAAPSLPCWRASAPLRWWPTCPRMIKTGSRWWSWPVPWPRGRC